MIQAMVTCFNRAAHVEGGTHVTLSKEKKLNRNVVSGSTLGASSGGRILSIQDNIIIGLGLKNAFMGEVVRFKTPESEIIGQVLNLERTLVRIVLIKGSQSQIKAGDSIHRTFKDAKTKVGFGVLGKLMSPLGEILNRVDYDIKDIMYSEVTNMEYASVEAGAPGIIAREPVRIPFLTGINAIDTFIPIGCGQRELVIGDQGVGKTTLAITAIINQGRSNLTMNGAWRKAEKSLNNAMGSALAYQHSRIIPCIYVGIGQKRSEIARIKKILEDTEALSYTAIVFTSADEPASIQFLAPYAGCTMGEWFRDRGFKAVIVYDDLSAHAVAYRQMSLLLRRPPGREAYPGDVFYVHSRLLERAAQLHKNLGGGSLTALPIIETRGGDISAYVPTNVISITDGQVFLSTELANKGIRPAINIGLSVSRVGSSAQTALMKTLSRKLKGNYAFYNNFKGIEKLGGDIDPIILSYIYRGKRIDEFFRQPVNTPTPYIEQVVGALCLTSGILDPIESKYIELFFCVLFSNEFVERYLKPALHMYGLEVNHMESWAFSENLFDFSKMEKEISLWCSVTAEYFVKELQPRLARDKKNLLFHSLRNLRKITRAN
jgi:proton translocating ATP synthase F1 alpha subunit